MKQKGTWIKTDGTKESVESKGRKFTLDELQAYVGGYIELTETKDGRDMYINEEGKLDGLPPNWAATGLYKHGHADVIAGNAIVIGEPRKRRAA